MKCLIDDPIEARIARKLVDAAIASGYLISLSDGEVWTVKRETDADAVFYAMGTTEADTLKFRSQNGEIAGSVVLVYGNCYDLIADHTDNFEMNCLVEEALGIAPKA